MVSTRSSISPLSAGILNTVKKRPRPAPRPPKYPPHISRAVVADLDDDVLDIGPKATPIEDLHLHYERKVKGEVVYLTKKGLEEERKKVCFVL